MTTLRVSHYAFSLASLTLACCSGGVPQSPTALAQTKAIRSPATAGNPPITLNQFTWYQSPQRKIPPNTDKTITEACHHSTEHAVSGGFNAAGPIYIAASSPTTKFTGWSVAVENHTSQSGLVEASVLCYDTAGVWQSPIARAKAAGSFGPFAWYQDQQSIPPYTDGPVPVACNNLTEALSGGFDGARVYITGSYPAPPRENGDFILWAAYEENHTSQSGLVEVSVLCDTTQRSRSPLLGRHGIPLTSGLHYKWDIRKENVPPYSEQDYGVSCGHIFSGGYNMSSNLSITASTPILGNVEGWNVAVTNRSSQEGKLKVYGLCVSL